MYRLLKDRFCVFMDRRHVVGEFYIQSLPMRWVSSLQLLHWVSLGSLRAFQLVSGALLFSQPVAPHPVHLHTPATLVFIKSSPDHVISAHRRPPEGSLNYLACGLKPPFQPPIPQMSSRCLMLCNPDFLLFPDTCIAC